MNVDVLYSEGMPSGCHSKIAKPMYSFSTPTVKLKLKKLQTSAKADRIRT